MAIAVVAGAVANKPCNGGEAWVRMSWVLGLRRLGFEVYFLERLRAAGCVGADGSQAPFAASVNRTHLERVVNEFALQDRVALLDERGETLHGIERPTLTDLLTEAELLFDLSGHLGGLALARLARRRVYVDLDPGFTQAWHGDPSLSFTLEGYDRYVTVGLNVGSDRCPIPTHGLKWIPTPPPILLEQWASEPPDDRGRPRFTTVSTWRSPHGAVAVGGRMPGLKHHEFRSMLELPGKVEGAQFELALDIDEADAADLQALQRHGWQVVQAGRVAATANGFRDYVRGSGAEFSVAQGVYAATASGWFSDRTGAYLAAGRPTLVQDTGLDGRLPLGEGLLSFSSLQQAVRGARRILADPAAHAQAARQIASEHLDSDRVLGRLLEALG
jgi:hypothetical protein